MAERVDDAFALAERVRETLSAESQLGWALASVLWEFRETEGWKALGHRRLTDWLADPDVGLTRTTFHRLVALWRHLVVERGVEPSALMGVDPAKAWVVLRTIRTDAWALDEALADARTLGMRDLRAAYRPERKDRTGQEQEQGTEREHQAGRDGPAEIDGDGAMPRAARAVHAALLSEFGRVDMEARSAWTEFEVAGARVTVDKHDG